MPARSLTLVTAWRVAGWLLRLATAVALAVDAYVHADLYDYYSLNKSPGTLSQGDLFLIEAGVASLAALLIIISGHRLVWAFAALIAASALGAVLIYADYDLGSIGPVPDMYEPLWYPEKQLTAWAEAVATGSALTGFVLAPKLRRRGSLRRRDRSGNTSTCRPLPVHEPPAARRPTRTPHCPVHRGYEFADTAVAILGCTPQTAVLAALIERIATRGHGAPPRPPAWSPPRPAIAASR